MKNTANEIKESKFFLAIREDNGEARAMKSGFDREIGFVLNIQGVKWKVVHLEEDYFTVKAYLGTFRKSVFHFFDFNSVDGRKA